MTTELRYTFEYFVKSEAKTDQISVLATSREEAEQKALPMAADYEFRDIEDIELRGCINIDKKIGDGYVACEGCAS